MALSRIKGVDGLYVGGLWALRRSDSLSDLGITHVLSLVGFDHDDFKNFKDEPWTVYGKAFRHLVIDVDDVDDTDLLVEMPRAVRFIDEALRDQGGDDDETNSRDEGGAPLLGRMGPLQPQDAGIGGEERGRRAVYVHCVAGKSRSVAVTVAYLLSKYPGRFDKTAGSRAMSSPSVKRGRRETASEVVQAALELIRRTRPMAEPNDGFMEQLALWWEMECPEDVTMHPVYQRWVYNREVKEHVAVGQAPSRLRFEDEQRQNPGNGLDTSATPSDEHSPSGFNLRCKKCRRTLATAPFIQSHSSARPAAQPCPHHFVEPLSWMRDELEKGQLSGRLACPNERCGAGVGRYDWKGLRCACGAWVTPALSLQRARVDEDGAATALDSGIDAARTAMGIRMPPGRSENL